MLISKGSHIYAGKVELAGGWAHGMLMRRPVTAEQPGNSDACKALATEI